MGASTGDQASANAASGYAGRCETTQPSPNEESYQTVYMRQRYAQRHAEALKILGGRCSNCGATEHLEFQRVLPRPDGRKGAVTRFFNASRENFLAELTRSILVCHGCRLAAISARVPHGGGLTGKRNCPCEPCRKRKRQYMRRREIDRAIAQELLAIQLRMPESYTTVDRDVEN